MAMEILRGSLLDAPDDAIILTIDGAAKGMEGNIARAFTRKYPDVWEELEFLQVFESMIAIYDRMLNSSPNMPVLRIYILNDVDFERALAFLQQNKYSLEAIGNGHVIRGIPH